MRPSRFCVATIIAVAMILAATPQSALSDCGDFDGNGSLSVSDVVALSHYFFDGGPAPSDYDQADFDLSEKLTFNDLAYLWACSPVCDFPENFCPPTEPAHDPIVDPGFVVTYDEDVLFNQSQFAISVTSYGAVESQAICLPLRIRIDGNVPQIDSIVTPTGSSYHQDSGNVPFVSNQVISADSGIVVIAGAKWNSSSNLQDPLAQIYVTVPSQPFLQPIEIQFVDLTPVNAAAGEEGAVFPMYLPPNYFSTFAEPKEPVLRSFCCRVAGDVNDDGVVTITDAVHLIGCIFFECICTCQGQCDPDGNGQPSISDAVYIINYIFGGGPAPVCQP